MNKILLVITLFFSSLSFSNELELINKELNIKTNNPSTTVAALFRFAKKEKPKLTPEEFRQYYLKSIVKNKFNFSVFKSKLK